MYGGKLLRFPMVVEVEFSSMRLARDFPGGVVWRGGWRMSREDGGEKGGFGVRGGLGRGGG